MKTYAIRNWEALFETSETRKLDALRWVATPNAHDGLGYVVLITAVDGPALFGCWNAILQLASRGDKASRGRLERDGRALTPEDIALLIRMPVELVERTLEMCSSDRVGWLQLVKHEQAELPLPIGNPATPAANPGRSGSAPASPARMEWNGIERIEGRGEKEAPVVAPKALPLPTVPPPPQASLPLSPVLMVMEKEASPATSEPDWIPKEMRSPEFVRAVELYREHLRQKGSEPTSFEWQTMMIEFQRAGLRRSIQVIDFTMQRLAKRLIWDDCPKSYKPRRCTLPAAAEHSSGKSALTEPDGFREWWDRTYTMNKGKRLADIAPHLRDGILHEFYAAQRAAA